MISFRLAGLCLALVGLGLCLQPSHQKVHQLLEDKPRAAVNGTFEGSVYYSPANEASWIDAVKSCATLGAVLTDVKSLKEFAFLRNLTFTTMFTNSPWVGAGAVGPKRSYVWISDFTKVRADFWSQGLPDPCKSRGHCVFLLREYQRVNAYECQARRRFICKFPKKNV